MNKYTVIYNLDVSSTNMDEDGSYRSFSALPKIIEIKNAAHHPHREKFRQIDEFSWPSWDPTPKGPEVTPLREAPEWSHHRQWVKRMRACKLLRRASPSAMMQAQKKYSYSGGGAPALPVGSMPALAPFLPRSCLLPDPRLVSHASLGSRQVPAFDPRRWRIGRRGDA